MRGAIDLSGVSILARMSSPFTRVIATPPSSSIPRSRRFTVGRARPRARGYPPVLRIAGQRRARPHQGRGHGYERLRGFRAQCAEIGPLPRAPSSSTGSASTPSPTTNQPARWSKGARSRQHPTTRPGSAATTNRLTSLTRHGAVETAIGPSPRPFAKPKLEAYLPSGIIAHATWPLNTSLRFNNKIHQENGLRIPRRNTSSSKSEPFPRNSR